jgi:hypothetical protein
LAGVTHPGHAVQAIEKSDEGFDASLLLFFGRFQERTITGKPLAA